MKLEVPQSFEDVAVGFSGDEWEMLSKLQKELHRDVMVQNYMNMISVGYTIPAEQLWLFIMKDEAITSDDTDRGMTVQQKQLLGNSTTITRNVDFTKIRSLQSFKGEHHDSEYDKFVPDKKSVIRQDLMQAGTRYPKCLQSSKRVISKTEIKKHMKMCTGERQCKWNTDNCISLLDDNNLTANKICSEKRQKNTLQTHEQMCGRKKPYECTRCVKSFTGKKRLAGQKIIHFEQQLHKYTTCDKNFTDKTMLRAHHLIQNGQDPYKCTKCGKCFSDMKCLTAHQSCHRKKKTYKCTVCDKHFGYKYNMVSHQRIHTGQKSYKCNMCDKSFLYRTSMLSHQSIHTGQKPYKCTMCDKSFGYRYSMLTHQMIHTGQKPYNCSMCDKSFKNKTTMLSHQVIHTGQKPYKCTVCDKSFAYKNSVVSHQRIHTGQKPYKCTMCDKSFAYKNSVVSHQRSHSRSQGSCHSRSQGSCHSRSQKSFRTKS
ncbi:gastrula zinc finger protein XlCGF57.1-like [Protopterus annectens]|uniref:gastrula zinc finger protein XlCGF57.1-like n=1 Tax=Protopterus annectens TaxID=7888 RepID=UPI001CFA031D|nr:gastrula zinc finger protein XlCGF57.1-like [Protopterus annectens]